LKTELKSFFTIHDKSLGILFFVLTVFFTHAPLFLFIPVPGIHMDTFGYFWFAKEIFDGQLPVKDMPTDFPWGYPLFLFIAKWFGGNILQMAAAQTFIFTLAGIWLIWQYAKSFAQGGIVAALALIIFTVQPHTIRHNLNLYSESLYTSSMLFFAGSIPLFFRTKKTLGYFLIVLSIFMLMIFRPNGILMLLVPVLILITESVRKKQNAKYYLSILLGILLFNAGCNYYFKGRFEVGDADRIKKVWARFIKKVSFKKSEPTAVTPATTSPGPATLFQHYFTNFYTPKSSFYYSLQKTNYEMVIKNEMHLDTGLKMFDGNFYLDEFAPGVREFIFQGYQPALYKQEKFEKRIDYYDKSHRNFWMMAVHLSYEITNKSKLLLILYIAFFITLGYYLMHWIKKRNFTNDIIIFSSLIHLINLATLPFIHGSFQLRYIHVTEFIVLLIALFGLKMFGTYCYQFFSQSKQKIGSV
jgi:hypothetical protein